MRTHDTGGCEFESSTCYNKNDVGEVGNRKTPHEIHLWKAALYSPMFFLR